MTPNFSKYPGRLRRASGIVRTAVVGLSTFAILLVCFSMYQYGQGGPAAANVPAKESRLPSPPTAFDADRGIRASGNVGGVKVGEAVIGSAQDIHFTLYPRKGTQAAIEISVSEYLPKEGSEREFLLQKPIARMRTKAGNDVRVSSQQGILEAYRKGAGEFDPRRGRLFGGVTIEFDRRTQEEKARLPEVARLQPDPDSIVLMEMDELEFDLEYNVLIVPGKFRLKARDAGFEASDLELRFDETQGKVQSLRIAQGGRIELRGGTDQFGVTIPGARSTERTSIVEWLRDTIRSRLAAAGEVQPENPRADGAAAEPALVMDGDVPIFRAGGGESRPSEPDDPLRYFARFEGDVDAMQQVDGVAVSRLTSDWLEVYRAFVDEAAEENRQAVASTEPKSAPPSADGAPAERIVLSWTGPLRVEALATENGGEPEPDRILAGGLPARLSSAEAEVICGRIEYQPSLGAAEFHSEPAAAVEVRSAEMGRLTGSAVTLRTTADGFSFDVVGPGTVRGKFDAGATELAQAQGDPPAGPRRAADDTTVAFERRLHGTGRIVHHIVPEFTGHIARRESRLLDRAVFEGGARVTSDEALLASDKLTLSFGNVWGSRKDFLSHVRAEGNVDWRRDTDRLACDELDIPLGFAGDGRSLPLHVFANGKIAAEQGGRTLSATHTFSIDFERVAPAISAKDAGTRSSTGREEALPKRVRASGAVRMSDSAQKLDLSAAKLDCTLLAGREVEHAEVVGTAEQPAKVHVGEWEVQGETIHASALDESADVPGPGRMTILSAKDLDGSRADKPIPIEVTWTESMRYRGRENVAHFNGEVRANSESSTTFEGRQLRVEFADAPVDAPIAGETQWAHLRPLLDRFWTKDEATPVHARFRKELASAYLVGDAVVQRDDVDPQDGALKSRARLAGPKMSVNLRPEASKALIEGAGTLQLESFEINRVRTAASPASPRGDLFAALDDRAPSKTLIQWTGRMWYDFAIDQVRFEDQVDLKFLSGGQLERAFKGPDLSGSRVPPGRATFLNSDILTIHLDREKTKQASNDARMGGLSADRISRFHANGGVVLKDEADEVRNWITATDLVYDRVRGIVLIAGGRKEQARVVRQEPSRLPMQAYVDNAIYYPATGKLDVSNTAVIGQ